jgi:hypothetical protein
LRRSHLALAVIALLLAGLMLAFDLEVLGLGGPSPGAVPP